MGLLSTARVALQVGDVAELLQLHTRTTALDIIGVIFGSVSETQVELSCRSRTWRWSFGDRLSELN